MLTNTRIYPPETRWVHDELDENGSLPVSQAAARSVVKVEHAAAPGTLYVDETNGRKLFVRKAIIGPTPKSVLEQFKQFGTWLYEEWLRRATCNVYVEYVVMQGAEDRVRIVFTPYNPTALEDWFYDSSEKAALLHQGRFILCSVFLEQFFQTGEIDRSRLHVWFGVIEEKALLDEL